MPFEEYFCSFVFQTNIEGYGIAQFFPKEKTPLIPFQLFRQRHTTEKTISRYCFACFVSYLLLKNFAGYSAMGQLYNIPNLFLITVRGGALIFFCFVYGEMQLLSDQVAVFIVKYTDCKNMFVFIQRDIN